MSFYRVFVNVCFSIFMILGNDMTMSVDNSVVDSSVTDWKPDVENKNNRGSIPYF